MRIIILAAGRGERLMPLTKNTPKSLIDMGNGNTLLEEQIKSIADSGAIDEIVLVLGYLAEQVEAKIKYHLNNGLKIKTVFNPFYDVSNNLMSLWFARHEMNEDFLITNGDNLFTNDVFKGLTENPPGIFLSVSRKERYDDDDMKVTIENAVVVKVSKKIPLEKVSAESPGLAMIKGERSRKIFVEHLDALARDKSYMNKFWLEVFNRLYEKGIPVTPWYFDGNSKWQEVDFHFDVEKVRELVQSKYNKIFGNIKTKR